MCKIKFLRHINEQNIHTRIKKKTTKSVKFKVVRVVKFQNMSFLMAKLLFV